MGVNVAQHLLSSRLGLQARELRSCSERLPCSVWPHLMFTRDTSFFAPAQPKQLQLEQRQQRPKQLKRLQPRWKRQYVISDALVTL